MAATEDPSPSEIARICAEIQRSWTPQECLKRLRCDLRPVVMGADGIACSVTAAAYDEHHERGGCLQ